MVVQELIAKLGFQVDGTSGVDQKLANLAKQAAAIAAAYLSIGAAIGAVMDAVKGAGQMEAMNAEFEVMLGNAEAAKYLVQEIQGFAAVTPFTTKGLSENIRLMMAFGISAKDSMTAVKMLGDVAGSDQEKLGRLALAYSQVAAAGKLSGQEVLQFVNAGFNPLTELTKTTGKSMAQLRKEMEKGLITSDMVRQAFEAATSKGGRFFGNMEKQSQTLFGLWSTLVDNFQILSAELGGQLVPFIKDVIRGVIVLSEGIAGAFRQLIGFFTVMFSDGPDALDIASAIAAAFMTIADAIMSVMSGMMFLKIVIESVLTLVSFLLMGIVAIPTGLLAGLVKVWSWIEEKIATALRYMGIFKNLASWLTKDAISADQTGDTILAPAKFLRNLTGEFGTAVGGDASKWNQMAGMIGGEAAAPSGSKTTLTDSILKALEGKGKTVNTNIENHVTIHAEGTMKDILTEQANSIFSLTVLQTRIAAAAV